MTILNMVNIHEIGTPALRIYVNQTKCLNSVLNVKVQKGALNQEKAQVGACSAIVTSSRTLG